MERRSMVVVSVLLLVAGLVACGKAGSEEISIDSGQPRALPTTTTTTTTTIDLDDDDDDHGDRKRRNEISCDDDSEPFLDGTRKRFGVTGFCDRVTVDGVELRVTIEATSELEIYGTGNEVEVTDSIDSATIDRHGVGNKLKVPDLDTVELDDESIGSDVRD